MTGLDQAIREIFKILTSYDYEVQLFDEQGAAVEEIEQARRMYIKKQNMLLTIIEDGENSAVNLKIGNNVDINSIEGLVQSLRTACNDKYILNFHLKRFDGKLNPKADTLSETRGNNMNIFEGLYGTSRSSYLKLENARMIIKHSTKIDETKHGARARCIESIFIENAQGERMLFPTNSLLPARAMAQHVSMGGAFHDQVACQIGRMAKDFSNLATCSQHVLNNGVALPESAQTVREACKKKLAGMKKTFEKMYRPNGYTVEASKMIEMANALIENEDEDNVDPEKIEEVRAMIALEGVNLSDELIETVCRAMKEDGEDLNEVQGSADKALGLENSVSVLGKRVSTQAWSDLANGVVRLTHRISYKEQGSTPSERDADISGYKGGQIMKSKPSVFREMILKLEQIIPSMEDDSLMNLMSYVASELGSARANDISSETREKMIKLTGAVLRAAGMLSDIPSKVPAVVEYFNWFNKLSAKSVLTEYSSPRSMMGHNPYDDEESDEGRQEEVIDHVVGDFDPTEFAETFCSDAGLDDESLDPDERVIEKDELLHSIEIHLLSEFSRVDDEINPPSEMKSEAKKLLPKVMDVLETKGFVINEDVDEENDPSSDDEPGYNSDLHSMLRNMDADHEGSFGDFDDIIESDDPFSNDDPRDVDARSLRDVDDKEGSVEDFDDIVEAAVKKKVKILRKT